MILEIIKVFVICWVFKDLFSFIGEIISEIKFKKRYLNLIKSLFAYILTCEKCSTMWFSLIMTGDLFISALLSLIINILVELQYKYKKTEL